MPSLPDCRYAYILAQQKALASYRIRLCSLSNFDNWHVPTSSLQYPGTYGRRFKSSAWKLTITQMCNNWSFEVRPKLPTFLSLHMLRRLLQHFLITLGIHRAQYALSSIVLADGAVNLSHHLRLLILRRPSTQTCYRCTQLPFSYPHLRLCDAFLVLPTRKCRIDFTNRV